MVLWLPSVILSEFVIKKVVFIHDTTAEISVENKSSRKLVLLGRHQFKFRREKIVADS